MIPAPDLALAQTFYEAVFGWRVQAHVPGPGYWFFQSGNLGGAFDGSGKPSPQSVVLVLRVEDMSSTLRAIEQHGGHITKGPGRIGEAAAGSDAYFRDPNGNELGVYCER